MTENLPTIIVPARLSSIRFPRKLLQKIDGIPLIIHTAKRIKEIAKNTPSFKDAPPETKAKEGDLVSFDYTATVDEKSFKGGEGKNTQLTLGKDLFLKGFDKQLIGIKLKEMLSKIQK